MDSCFSSSLITMSVTKQVRNNDVKWYLDFVDRIKWSERKKRKKCITAFKVNIFGVWIRRSYDDIQFCRRRWVIFEKKTNAKWNFSKESEKCLIWCFDSGQVGSRQERNTWHWIESGSVTKKIKIELTIRPKKIISSQIGSSKVRSISKLYIYWEKKNIQECPNYSP